MIKIYSDRSQFSDRFDSVTMLHAFWKPREDPEDLDNGMSDRYVALGKNYFQMSDLASADLAVLPMNWGNVVKNQDDLESARQFAATARSAGKPVVIFYWSDSEDPVPVSDSYIFRTSFRRSTRKSNEYSMPSWSEDFVAKYLDGKLPLRSKGARPVVGFCGYALRPNLKNNVMHHVRGVKNQLVGTGKPLENGPLFRGRIMSKLSKAPGIETNFLIRNSFFGTQTLDYKKAARREYIDNMVNSDYVICARGAGNYSYRLYETLCCGRIPVFIDTDCVLPYDFAIDWKDYCVWVDEKEIPQVADKVLDFHNRLSAEEFIELQQRCRKLWEDWLSPEGYFANFHRHFKQSPGLSADC